MDGSVLQKVQITKVTQYEVDNWNKCVTIKTIGLLKS